MTGSRKFSSGIKLAAVSAPVLRVLRMAKLDQVFAIHERIDDALAVNP